MLVLQNAGPHAPECMPEAGYLPIPRKLAQRGVKDMVRVSDARMSGTAFGTIVLHVTPDSASGGPLGLVRNGDRIRLSVKERRIELLIEDGELKQRASTAKSERPKAERGYASCMRRRSSALMTGATCVLAAGRGRGVMERSGGIGGCDLDRSAYAVPPASICRGFRRGSHGNASIPASYHRVSSALKLIQGLCPPIELRRSQGRKPMAVESIFYSVSGISCRGALVWDESVKAPRPLLLMAPNWRGVIKPAIETGQMLAGEGYVVFVADMFGEGNGPVGTENPMEFLRPFMSDVAGMRRRIAAALDTLTRRPTAARSATSAGAPRWASASAASTSSISRAPAPTCRRSYPCMAH